MTDSDSSPALAPPGPACLPRPPAARQADGLPAHWLLPEFSASEAASLAQSAALPLLIAQLLVQRGVRTPAEAEAYFQPQVESLHDPYSMRGMAEAVTRIQRAVEGRESILIYGDYDVDGVTAVVLLKTAIEMLGGRAAYHIPHRLRDGYGMQSQALEEAAAAGVRLVITVDNGIREFAAAAAAQRLNLDLIITDHHLPSSHSDGSESDVLDGCEPLLHLPPALAILNPNQPGCGYPCKHLCGAGVAFKLAQALLEAQDRTRARSKILPSFLKLLAIASVADAVPLLGENRVMVSLGLAQLRQPASAGLRCLMQNAGLDPAGQPITAEDLAYRIAPRINAAGRMDVASDVVELFGTRDPQRARELAGKLDRLNAERRQAEAAMLAEIEARLEREPAWKEARCIVMDGEAWHRGIIGILASRIVERMRMPAIVIAREGEQSYGSGRSIPGFHLLRAVESCRELFTRFGGHEQAAGFCLPTARTAELRRRLEMWAAEHSAAEEPPVECHAWLPLDRITPSLMGWLRRMEPLGAGNRNPVFVAHNARICAPVRTMKDRHVRMRLSQSGGAAFPALGWNWAARLRDLGLGENSAVHAAYRLRENQHPEFAGIELEIVDLCAAAEDRQSAFALRASEGRARHRTA